MPVKLPTFRDLMAEVCAHIAVVTTALDRHSPLLTKILQVQRRHTRLIKSAVQTNAQGRMRL